MIIYIILVGSKTLPTKRNQCMGKKKMKKKTKNREAMLVLQKLLNHSIWYNIHQLPHDIIVFEVRISQGYGFRYEVYPNKQFRGFLEYHQIDGHEKGWKH